MSKTNLIDGVVTRVAGAELAYVALDDGTVVSIQPQLVTGFAGREFPAFGIFPDARVSVQLQRDTGIVNSVNRHETSQPPDPARSISEAAIEKALRIQPEAQDIPNAIEKALRIQPEAQDIPNAVEASQIELSPKAKPVGKVRLTYELFEAKREFGKLLNVDNLRPGDLLLTRDEDNDDEEKGKIGRMIVDVQSRHYGPLHARWTHAAMYLGDGRTVVEATFDKVPGVGDVRMTDLDEYCNGSTFLRFRRSKYVKLDAEGWRLCVRALSRLRQPYDTIEAARIWFYRNVLRREYYDREKSATRSAASCSTLYADAYAEVTSRILGELKSNICLPATLSLKDEFDDIEVSWIEIDPEG